MANLIFNQGLVFQGGRTSNTTDNFGAVQSMSVDSGAAFTNGTTNLGGPAASVFAIKNFDSTPTWTSGANFATVTHITTFATGDANFTIRRVALHNAGSGTASSGTNTLFCGTDGQSFGKTSDFSLVLTYKVNYTSV